MRKYIYTRHSKTFSEVSTYEVAVLIGLFLMYVLLSTRFGSLDISMEKNFQVSPQPTGQASRSPSSIRGYKFAIIHTYVHTVCIQTYLRPSKSPISFSPVTNASIPAPTASPIVAQPVVLLHYFLFSLKISMFQLLKMF